MFVERICGQKNSLIHLCMLKLACSTTGCNKGISVCEKELDGVCRIQCGPQHYRDGEYCYYCDDIVEDMTVCQDCDGKGLCSKCLPGYELDQSDHQCHPCPGTSYGTDGKTFIPVSNCTNGETGKTEPSCTKCMKGNRVSGGRCEVCPGTSYGNDGKTCKAIDHCAAGYEGQSVPSCHTCTSGYYEDNGVCNPCPETSYGTDGKTCIPISNCAE